MSHVFVVGFMGAGKTTVGRLLAAMLGLACVDVDERVEEVAGRPISQIFELEGEPAFRERESRELRRAIEGPDAVIACGGGVVLDDENRRLMKESGVVVYLEVTAEEALARVGNAETRPLLSGDSGRLAGTLLAARRALYEAVADVTVDTSGETAADVAGQACRKLSARVGRS